MIPIIDLSDDPRERGRTHGDALRSDIAQRLDRYVRRFALFGCSREAFLADSSASAWRHAGVRLLADSMLADAYAARGMVSPIEAVPRCMILSRARMFNISWRTG